MQKLYEAGSSVSPLEHVQTEGIHAIRTFERVKTEFVAEIFGELREQKTHWPKHLERLGPRFKELWGLVWHQIDFPPEPRIPW